MAKKGFGTSKEHTEFGRELIAAAKEALAHSRGEIALPTRRIEPMPAKKVKEIRRKVAKTTREFETVTGIPARTVEGWEQGRGLDAPARALLRVIEKEPQAVSRALDDLPATVDELIRLSRSPKPSAHQIDRLVDSYVAGFGPYITTARRTRLANCFHEKANGTRSSDFVHTRILRETEPETAR